MIIKVKETLFSKSTVEDIRYNKNRVLIIVNIWELLMKRTCYGNYTYKVLSII